MVGSFFWNDWCFLPNRSGTVELCPGIRLAVVYACSLTLRFLPRAIAQRPRYLVSAFVG